MKQTRTRVSVSVIIPAYNEAGCIADCLDSLARQTMRPHEVIVVDNNSADRTAAIAGSYDFVTVLHETRQGQTAARNCGFDAATGEVLARVNADVTLEEHWVERIAEAFADPNIVGIAGAVRTRALIHTPRPLTRLYTYAYVLASEAYFGSRMMWGANMMLRRSSWQQIRHLTCPDDAIVHEDIDLSLLVDRCSGKVRLRRDIMATTYEESYFYWPKLKEYSRRFIRTRQWHEVIGTYDDPAFHRLSPMAWLVRQPFTLLTPAFSGLSWLYYQMSRMKRLSLQVVRGFPE